MGRHRQPQPPHAPCPPPRPPAHLRGWQAEQAAQMVGAVLGAAQPGGDAAGFAPKQGLRARPRSIASSQKPARGFTSTRFHGTPLHISAPRAQRATRKQAAHPAGGRSGRARVLYMVWRGAAVGRRVVHRKLSGGAADCGGAAGWCGHPSCSIGAAAALLAVPLLLRLHGPSRVLARGSRRG